MMGLLDPRLMAFLQQRGVQMPPQPTNMGGYAPPMPRVIRPMPQPKAPNPVMTAPGFPILQMNSGTFFPARPNMQVDPRSYVMPPRNTFVPARPNMQVDPRSYAMPPVGYGPR